jgi:polyisoprenoid-binding protein YceI
LKYTKLSHLFAATLIAASAAVAGAQTTTWKIDPAHSQAAFTIRHMGISNVNGRFGNISGTIFASKILTRSGDDYAITGDLTIHGVTRRVVLKLDAPAKEQLGPDNKLHRGFSASTTIRRQDFGLVWAGTLKSGDAMVGDDAKITLDIEAVKE